MIQSWRTDGLKYQSMERAPIVSVIEIRLDRSIVDIYGPISEENVFVSEQKKDESN